MRFANRVWPGLVLLGVLPVVGLLPSETPVARFLLPLLPYIVVHLTAVRQPGAMPSWLAFAAGLGVDLGTSGPIGFWALVYLAGLFMVAVSPSDKVLLWADRVLLGVVTMAAVTLLAGLVGSAYLMHWVDWLALMIAGGVAASILGFLEIVIPGPVGRPRGFGADTARLQRGE